MLLKFDNFYQQFIKVFNKIALSLISILKIIPLADVKILFKIVDTSTFLTSKLKLTFCNKNKPLL